MKGGNAQEFVDGLSLGLEKEFVFKERTLFAQGYYDGEKWEFVVDQWNPEIEGYLWSTSGASMAECFAAFLNEPLFDGLTFWQAEKDIEWIAG